MRKIFILSSLLISLPASAFTVKVEPEEPRPGDILRVELVGLDNSARARCEWNGASVPFYAVGPGRMRALIGLTARLEPRWYALKVSRARFLLPDETKTIGVTVAPREFTHQNITMPRKKTLLAGRPEAKAAIVKIREALRGETPAQRWEGAFLRPAEGRRTSKYGHTRTINRRMSWDWHKGIDIAAGEGAPIISPNGGTVVLAGRFPVQGGMLIVDHGQGLMSAFLHLHTFKVAEGRTVEKGSVIAEVGGGGFSTGSHLHWGVYVHGEAVDPEALLDRAF